MRKSNVNVKLQIQLMKEGQTVVVYCPALDLCGYGDSPQEAMKDFDTAIKIFLRETTAHRTLDKALEELGWKRVRVDKKTQWRPQIEILNSNIEKEFNIPLPT